MTSKQSVADMADEPTEIRRQRQIKLTFSTKSDPKCCQVCESVEDIRDISMDDDTKEQLMRIFGKTPDKKVEHLMKHLCISCAFKLFSINEFRQQYLATYENFLAQTEDEDNDKVVQQEKCVETEYLYNEIDQLPDELEEGSEDIIFCATGTTSQDRRIHMDKKSHKCMNCSKCFTSSYHLKIHMRIHTDEKPYSCDICLSSFRQQGHLKGHLLIHSGEKPFKCEICLNSFREKSKLRIHMFTHTGEKPYRCEICPNYFRQMSTLKKHMRTHTGEKPHSCEICLTSFRREDNLRRHMLIHSGEKPHKCTKCGQKFRYKNALKTHIRRLHPKDYPVT